MLVKGNGLAFLAISNILDLYVGYQITKRLNSFGVFGSYDDLELIFMPNYSSDGLFSSTDAFTSFMVDLLSVLVVIVEYVLAFGIGVTAGRLLFHGILGFAMGSFCLRFAAVEDSRELAEFGLKLGGVGDDIHEEDSSGGYSPLSTASEKGHLGVLSTLVAAGCKPSCHHLEGALRCHHEDVALYLIKCIAADLEKETGDSDGGDLRLEDPYWPLHRAVHYNCLPVVEELLRVKAYDPAEKDEFGKTAFAIGVERRHYECVLALFNHSQLPAEELRSTVLGANDGGAFLQDLLYSELHVSVTLKEVSSMGFTFDGQSKGEEGRRLANRLLHRVTNRMIAELASEFYDGSMQALRKRPILLLASLLLSAGADPCSPDPTANGRTCLHKVAQVGWPWACEFILKRKTNVFEEI
eukprot:CAMPEP_0113892360 /NCGR_PEP_ID=MMETSP0780_2-20120614/15364_1 /TAXON_ID=652834 /ORGANISM="Palpitomonas bilix" /LENGTH=410 /DNA_ID=CAMNT_0000882271 /DNA_START=225 /DNA_END=1457 /DNA_ORIENTATION=- /assembly_acc=CAM_ASM_000599